MDMAEKDDTEGRCPACRVPYDKEKIVGMAEKCERFYVLNTTSFGLEMGMDIDFYFLFDYSLLFLTFYI